VGIVAATQGSTGKPSRASHAQRLAARPAQRAAPAKPAAAAPAPRTQPTSKPATTGNPSTPPTTTGAGASADALEARGHTLMEGGSYAAAIPVLRQALAAAPPTSLTYAYALFDLGRSLRLAGDPRQAVQVLWQRMQIPNQTDVVRTELQLALQELGQRASSTGGAPTGPPAPGPGRDNGHGSHSASPGGPPGPSADAGGGANTQGD
jgi:tetratricopeptide (TPR) repeat protein